MADKTGRADNKLKLDPINKPVVGKEVRDLAAEIQQDEHAARVRDSGSEDAATHEQRVKEGAEMSYNPQPQPGRDRSRGGLTR
jgi:hypothetical protein